MNSRYKAIVFDLDGTLLDTSEGVFASVCHAAKMLGLKEPDQSMVDLFIGPPIKHSLMDVYHLSEEEASRGTEFFRDIYKSQNLFMAEPYEGIIALVEALRDAGYKVGVATLKREDYAYDLLKHFGITDFCESVCGSDAASKMMKPDVLRKCLGELGVEPEDAVLIGDTSSDGKGAMAVGTDFMAVTFGFGPHTPAEWQDYKPVFIAADTKQIAEFLEVTI